jgi:hypothetical protein
MAVGPAEQKLCKHPTLTGRPQARFGELFLSRAGSVAG